MKDDPSKETGEDYLDKKYVPYFHVTKYRLESNLNPFYNIVILVNMLVRRYKANIIIITYDIFCVLCICLFIFLATKV